MRILVTGGAGFIGSTLVDRLLAAGHDVIAFDNLSTGRRAFLASALASPAFALVEGSTLDAAALGRVMAGVDQVFHLAANADVRFGPDDPRRDLDQNTVATFNVLEAMRAAGVRRIAFASTGSVYGKTRVFPTPEDAPFPVQTSIYAATKLAGEALISAYAEAFGFEGCILRLVSVLGERYTHGHIVDFHRSLGRDSSRLRILGDGRQRKSYLYVGDAVDAMVRAAAAVRGRIEIFNVGHRESIELHESIRWICERLAVSPVLEYTGGEGGWPGDNPVIDLDISKIERLGWAPVLTIRDSVHRTIDYLQQQSAPVEVRS